MKNLAFASIIVAVFALVAWGQGLRPKLPGSEPYTPTKLEWLTVNLNAEFSHKYAGRSTPDLSYVASRPTDTVTVYVRYHPQTERAVINRDVEFGKDVVLRKARLYGWDTWVKIKEDVAMFEQ